MSTNKNIRGFALFLIEMTEELKNHNIFYYAMGIMSQ